MSREKNNCFTSPVLGAAYYPEDWNVSEQEHDIAYMRKGGLKCVRIGEFAWHRMEPSEGEFDFAWLHQILDKLAYAGISVILGTPTATPPIWLIEKDPEILGLSDSGLRESHGGRRHCCSNSPTYRKYSARIVEKMVREFGKDERIVGWQIDNEIHVRGGGCYCAECRRRFAEHLKRKYGTVENLNQSWNLNLFSQWYDTFEQIPAPRTMDWHNPHLQYEWLEFQGDSHIDFIRMQADILHKYTDAPVGSDMMPIFGVDHEQIAEFSDVMQYNHYNNEKDLWWTILWFDYMRTLKERPFWNTETSTCWNGGTSVPSDIRPEGFCRVNSWLPVALGGEGNFYWLWRQHWAGHELMHGSVLYASGRPMHTFGEVQEVAAGFEKAGDFLCGTRVVTDVAMMISAKADNLMTWQMVATEEKAYKSVYTRRVQSFHKDIAEHGIRPDVIGTKSALDGYKLLITPYMLTLEMEGLPERIEKWVREGGTWLVGPMTDIRNTVGAHYTD